MNLNLPPELVETLLTRSNARILASQHTFSAAHPAALFHLNRLFEHYLTILIHRILSFSRTGQRTKVNLDDVELTLFMENVSLESLESEIIRLHRSSEEYLEPTDRKVARGFETIDRKTQSLLLGPELGGRARGIPEYMEKGMMLPALPPLYTYRRTAIWNPRISSGREIREASAMQSRAAEGALRSLIEIQERLERPLQRSMSVGGIDDGDGSEGSEDVESVGDEAGGQGNDARDVMIDADDFDKDERKRRERELAFREVFTKMGFGAAKRGGYVTWE